MAYISMKQLLEAGMHFGHQTRCWNPKMAPYIFTKRNGIHIIDLKKTARKVDEAYSFIRDTAMEGKSVLFVGTKKQAQRSIESEAKRCNMFYVNNRWLGGMLTNFKTIRTRIERLNQIDKMEQNGQFDVLPKKEVIKLTHERDKLETNLGGIREMKKLPDALFIVDPRKEHIAVTEARILGIPIVGIVDTNCDPDEIDYVIPGNNDAIRAVKLIAGKLADAVLEGKQSEQVEDEGAYIMGNKNIVMAGGGIVDPPKRPDREIPYHIDPHKVPQPQPQKEPQQTEQPQINPQPEGEPEKVAVAEQSANHFQIKIEIDEKQIKEIKKQLGKDIGKTLLNGSSSAIGMNIEE